MTWSSDWTTLASSESGSEAAPAVPWQPGELGSQPPAQRGAPPRRGREAAEADRMAAEARALAQRQAEIDEAYSRGFDEGCAEAARVERERVESVLRALQKAVAAVQSSQAQWTRTAHENISALAVGVARHVVGRELRGDAHAIAELTRQALTQFPASEPVRVRLHPHDLSLLTAATAPAGGSILVATGRDVQWTADAEVPQGGCIVEGPTRVVDGRVDHALERIYQKLADD